MSEGGTIMVLEKPIQPETYINTVRRAAGLDELESEDKSEKDVLKVKLKEKLKKADKKTLQDVMKILDTEPEGGNKQ